MQLLDRQSNTVIVSNLRTAYTFIHRFKGLMFDRELSNEEALHIQPCRSIHTCFMRFSIDVIYVDDLMNIVALEADKSPYRFGKSVKGAHSVIEMPAGSIKSKELFVGQALLIQNNERESEMNGNVKKISS